MSKRSVKVVIPLLIICFLTYSSSAKDFLITKYGARQGMQALNTIAINKAIEACSKAGGGRVVVPAGIFRTGTIMMESNVELDMPHGWKKTLREIK